MVKQIVGTLSLEHYLRYFHEHRSSIKKTSGDVYDHFKPVIDQLPKLTIGPFFWQIYDNSTGGVLTAGGDVKKVTPFTKQDLLNAQPGPEFMLSIQHPQEKEFIFSFVKTFSMYVMQLPAAQRNQQSITIYCHLKNAQGNFHPIAIQYPSFYFDETGKILYALIVYFNLSKSLVQAVMPSLSILDFANECQFFYTGKDVLPGHSPKTELLKVTKREAQILDLMIAGKASKEIAAILNIAKNTVENHRQRLLKKFNVKSSIELVGKLRG